MTPDLATALWLVAMAVLILWLIHDPKGGARADKG